MQQTTQQVNSKDSAVNRLTVWNNLSGSAVLDSSLAGVKRTVNTHLFTVEK